MILLAPIIILLLLPLIMTVIHFWRPKSGLSWLVAALGTLIVWLAFLVFRLDLPQVVTIKWQPASIAFAFVPMFELDKTSWPFALTLSACLLAYILTSIIHYSSQEKTPSNWWQMSAGLLFGAIGLIAIFAVNLYPIILAWVAIDLLWLLLYLVRDPNNQPVKMAFSLRIAGVFFVVAASFHLTLGTPLRLPLTNDFANVLLYIGAFIRIGSIWISPHHKKEYEQTQALEVFGNLVVVASVLVLITRIASAGFAENTAPFLLVVTSIFAIFGGLIFVINPHGKAYGWIWGLSGLGFAAAVSGQVNALQAWSFALLISGSILLFNSIAGRFITFVLTLGLIGFLALPFTPAWQGVWVLWPNEQVDNMGTQWVLRIVALGLLVVGYLRRASRNERQFLSAERWSWVVYGSGFAILIITQWVILLFGIPGLTNDLESFPPLNLVWANLLVIVIAVLLFWLSRRFPKLFSITDEYLGKISVYSGITRSISTAEKVGVRFVRALDRLLEEEGGILWSILFLLLLIALLFQLNRGG